ncbi:hypothetical protein M3J09_000282 [Ascochyta lentis]
MQHNDPVQGSDWPCRASDPNGRLPDMQENDQAILGMDQDLITGCVPCRLKAFMKQYWGKVHIRLNGEPSSFPYRQVSILPLHKLAERWMCRLPDAPQGDRFRPGETPSELAARRLASETADERAVRVARACNQQCADEYFEYLRAGLLSSIDPSNQRRLDEFNALFMLQRHEETRCFHCNEHLKTTEYEFTEETGFSNIKPVFEGSDDLLAALERSTWLEPDTNESLKCTSCKENGAITTRQIEAAPVYLRIHLDVSMKRGNDQYSVAKNRTPIKIPDVLDLTRHAFVPNAGREPWPLRYKLASVLYHAGPFVTGGHWTAGVSRPIPKPQRGRRDPNAPSAAYYFCNDETIQAWPANVGMNPLTVNPEKRASSEFNAVVLMYERLPRVAPKRDYTAELGTELDAKYYGASKKKSEGEGEGSKKRKKADDGEEKGLRRSKRLKEKDL